MRLLTEMEVFVEAARVKHFGRAAAAIGITASTLSRRIKALERELGVILIRRSTRSFALTEPGQEFLRRSENILREALRAREEIGISFNQVSGHLRVGLPSDLAITVLAPVIAKFVRDHPAISVDVITVSGQPDLSRDRLDVAFSVAHQIKLPDSSYAAHHVGSFSRMMFASRTYLKRKGIPDSPQALQDHACLRYFDRSPEHFWELFRGRRQIKIGIKGACACSSVAAVAQLARGHLGIAMLPLHLANHPTFGAGLMRVLPEWEGAPVNVFAITAERALPAKVKELIRLAKVEFGTRVAQLESIGDRVCDQST